MIKSLYLTFLVTFQIGISLAQTPGFEWVHAHGGADEDAGRAITSDQQNNVYTTGFFTGTVDFDPGTGVTNLTSALNGVFIQKLNAAGNLVWAKSFPQSSAVVTSIAVDPSNNIILGGYFYGTINFTTTNGTNTISSPSDADAFVVKMNSDGDFVWARSFGNPNKEDFVNGIQTDDQGNIYSTGHFYGLTDFDPGTGTANMTSAGATMDIFVQKLTAAGDYVWAKKIGGGGFDEGVSVAVKGTNVLLTGWFQMSVDMDPSAGSNVINTVGYSDIYLVSLSTDGNFNWAESFGSVYTDKGFRVALDNTGQIYLTGIFDAAIDLDPGTATNVFTADNGTNFFILKLTETGDFSWARTFIGTDYKACRSIAVHPNNGIVAVGEFMGTTDFDCGTGVNNLTAVEQADAFIVYLDQNGNYMWAGSFGNTGISYNDLAYDVTVDSQGNIYTIGRFVETVDFDCGSGTAEQTSAGWDDMYVQKINSNVLAVNENDLSGFKLYPNPSDRFINISAENLNDCHIAICNSLGMIVLEKDVSDMEAQLDIQSLSAGSYVVQLTNESGSSHQTFVKID